MFSKTCQEMSFSDISNFYKGLTLKNIGKYWKIVKYSTGSNSNVVHAILYKISGHINLDKTFPKMFSTWSTPSMGNIFIPKYFLLA